MENNQKGFVLIDLETGKPLGMVSLETLIQEAQILEFDDVPVEGSSNPVKSGGLFTSLAAKVDLTAMANYINGGAYNSTSKKIELKNDSTVIAEIDATAFIKDGMVSSVEVSGSNLVITFNTDSGKEPISIPISSIFDSSLYYTKTEVDAKIKAVADRVTTIESNYVYENN